MSDSYSRHRDRVEQIADKVEQARSEGKQPTITHGSSHSVRPEEYTSDERIHVERLDHFISIDPDGQSVLMEPDITMRELVDRTLEHGLIPHVVPEFPTITVGGAIQGGAGESSCFRYGLFGDHCTRFEMVTGDGEIVDATREDNSDLFHGTLGSYGSMGILTEVEMDLLPAKEYVRLRYIPVTGFTDALKTIDEYCETDADFIDAIMFSRDHGVVMVGELSDTDDLPVERFTRPTDEWFYIHARNVSQEEGHVENIPIRDYFFRYDIGAFWAVKYGFEEVHMPFNRLTRTLLHPFTSTSVAYDSGIHGGNFSSGYVIQDIITRREDTIDLLEWADDNLGIYPLWLLPLEPESDAFLAPSYLDTDLAINVGIWGQPASEDDPRQLKRRLEEKQMEMGARKTLYAQQFYTEDEFWSIYDRERYDELRQRYSAAGAFPTVYEVTHVDELPEPSLWKAATSMLDALL